MTLLQPFSAIIAGAIAGPILIALYLLKLRRRPMRVSTIAFWARAAEDLQANVPFRWLRPSWLLLLHLLILALLVLALGRPVAEMPGVGGASRVVLLIDRSASMTARDMPEGASRLDAAKTRAKALARELMSAASGRAVAVVAFAHEPQALTRFTRARSSVLEAIDSITPTDQAGDLPAALELVEAFIAPRAEDESDSEPAGIILVSDGSFEGLPERAIRGGNVRLEAIAPPAASPEAATAKIGAPASAKGVAAQAASYEPNLGLIALSARRDYQDPLLVRVFARVLNAGVASRTSVLTLSLNGRVVERRAIDVPGATTPPSAATGAPPVNGTNPAPGENSVTPSNVATLTFDLPAPDGGVVTVSLPGGDALASDDLAATVLGPAARPAIALVRPVPTPNAPPRVSDFLLDDALAELNAKALRTLTPAEAEATFAAADAPFDLVIYDRVTPTRVPRIPSLSFGAGLPIMGLALSSSDAASPVDVSRATMPAQPILAWDRTHPILRYVPLDSVIVEPAPPFAAAAPPEGVSIADLARGASSPLIRLADDRGTRRLVVAFDLAGSNWQMQVGFPIFLASAVDYLTLRGEASVGRAFTTSQPVTLSLRPAAATSRVVLDGPTKLELDASRAAPDARELSAGALERAGVYLIESPRILERAIAVNLLDATESSLRVDRSLTLPGTTAATSDRAGQRELWPWFVIAAAVLLFIEWFVYGARMRG